MWLARIFVAAAICSVAEPQVIAQERAHAGCVDGRLNATNFGWFVHSLAANLDKIICINVTISTREADGVNAVINGDSIVLFAGGVDYEVSANKLTHKGRVISIVGRFKVGAGGMHQGFVSYNLTKRSQRSSFNH
jgi:hypothetical protein